VHIGFAIHFSTTGLTMSKWAQFDAPDHMQESYFREAVVLHNLLLLFTPTAVEVVGFLSPFACLSA